MARAVDLVKVHFQLSARSLLPRPPGRSEDAGCPVPPGAGRSATLKPGTLDARWGGSAAACCRKAVELAKSGDVVGIASAPFDEGSVPHGRIKAMDDMTYYEECFATGAAYQVGEVAGSGPHRSPSTWPSGPFPISSPRRLSWPRSGAWTQSSKAARVSPAKIGVVALNVHCGEGACSAGKRSMSSDRPSGRPRRRGSNVADPGLAGQRFPASPSRGDSAAWSSCTTTRRTSGGRSSGVTSPE